jgi:hypothetical protein
VAAQGTSRAACFTAGKSCINSVFIILAAQDPKPVQIIGTDP